MLYLLLFICFFNYSYELNNSLYTNVTVCQWTKKLLDPVLKKNNSNHEIKNQEYKLNNNISLKNKSLTALHKLEYVVDGYIYKCKKRRIELITYMSFFGKKSIFKISKTPISLSKYDCLDMWNICNKNLLENINNNKKHFSKLPSEKYEWFSYKSNVIDNCFIEKIYIKSKEFYNILNLTCNIQENICKDLEFTYTWTYDTYNKNQYVISNIFNNTELLNNYIMLDNKILFTITGELYDKHINSILYTTIEGLYLTYNSVKLDSRSMIVKDEIKNNIKTENMNVINNSSLTTFNKMINNIELKYKYFHKLKFINNDQIIIYYEDNIYVPFCNEYNINLNDIYYDKKKCMFYFNFNGHIYSINKDIILSDIDYTSCDNYFNLYFENLDITISYNEKDNNLNFKINNTISFITKNIF
jgi:hypothetical protein